MKKLLLAVTALAILPSCSSGTQDILTVLPEVDQASALAINSQDNPEFTRKRKEGKAYRVKTRHASSTCGPDDLQHVNSYDGKLGQPVEFVNAKKPAVGAMATGNTDKSSKFCSGTLIGENLFLTASHCVDGATNGNTYVAFNYERAKGATTLLPQKHFKVLEIVEDGGNLDYAILKLDGTPGKEFGFSKIKSPTPEKGHTLTIIQHPSGEAKQVEIGTRGSIAGNYMGYGDLDTEPGSSGSGVLDADGNVVGVHTNGGCSSSGGENKGVMMSQIAKVSKIVQKLDIASPSNRK